VETLTKIGALTLGGALGVNARYFLGLWMSRWTSPQFPWATFAINISGSFAIGFLAVLMDRWWPHPYLRLALITGVLGGYTTFSTFEYESAGLWERGDRQLAATNLVASLGVGLLAVFLGIVLGRAFTNRVQTPPGSAPKVAAKPDSAQTVSPGKSSREPKT
jgi:CrcB protein